MDYIIYDKENMKFCLTGERPNNQSQPTTLHKLFIRYEKRAERDRSIVFTEIQQTFLEKYTEFQKKRLAYKEGIKKCNKYLKIFPNLEQKIKLYLNELWNLKQKKQKKLKQFKDKEWINKSDECLENLEQKFKSYRSELKELEQYKQKYKELKSKLREALKKKFPLKDLGIDIAHGIAISEIIETFVDMMNNSKVIKIKNVYEFVDATLSTEKADDDRGRKKVKKVLKNVKDFKNNKNKKGYEVNIQDFLKDVNDVIELINSSTRNLTAGVASINRAIGNNQDNPVGYPNGDTNRVKYLPDTKEILHSFKQINKEYGSKTVIVDGIPAQYSANLPLGKVMSFDSDAESCYRVLGAPAKKRQNR